MEPREIKGNKVTRWDIGLWPPGSLVEAKLTLGRSHVIDWLRRAAEAGTTAAHSYALTFGKSKTGILASLERLIAIAVELDGDEKKFGTLVEREEIAEADVILEAGLPGPFDVAASDPRESTSNATCTSIGIASALPGGR